MAGLPLIMKGQTQKLRMRRYGLIVNPKWPYLGASPDGIVQCTYCPKRVLEIKCPYMYRAMDVRIVKDDSFYHDADLKLKVGHAYHDQLQGQLALEHDIFSCVDSQDSLSASLGDPKGRYIFGKASAKASHSFLLTFCPSWQYANEIAMRVRVLLPH